MKALQIFVVMIATLTMAFSANGQTPAQATAAEQAILNELAALRKEVAEVRQIVTSQRATLPVSATRTEKLPQRPDEHISLPFIPRFGVGDKNAKYVVVEFADLQCPFCSFYQKNTFPKFANSHLDTGKVRFLSVDFPLESHPDAARLSLAAICAGDQGKYWEMRERLMGLSSPSSSTVEEQAASLGLARKDFDACASSSLRQNALKEQAAVANAAGIYSTPSFLVGHVVDGKIEGTLIVGAMSPEDFSQHVNEVIAKLEGTDHDHAKQGAER